MSKGIDVDVQPIILWRSVSGNGEYYTSTITIDTVGENEYESMEKLVAVPSDVWYNLFSEVIEDIQSWACYADEYFQHKHDLDGVIVRWKKLADIPSNT